MTKTERAEVVVIGGGSAGMAAALAAKQQGVNDVLIIERSPELGGILRQCIHNGFGIHKFKEDLTGTEYAHRYIKQVHDNDVSYLTDTFVLDISADKEITFVNSRTGLRKLRAKAVVLAMGCRERSRGTLLIPGSRPAGVFTAGTAQRYMNIDGYLPGKKIVILGSGDIGLIMAKQLTLEGAQVCEVAEIMPHSNGLGRNIAQCLQDFSIPLSLNSTVVEVSGRDRLQSVTIAQVNNMRQPISGSERVVPCDTLLISAGLIPENELSRETGVDISRATGGAFVDDSFHTSVPGVFSCGNVLHVHDLVDNVSFEGELAGSNAALFAQGKLFAPRHKDSIPVHNGNGIGSITPQFIRREEDDTITLMFRPRALFTNCTVFVHSGEKCIAQRKYRILTPGEMSEISISRSAAVSHGGPVTISTEE